MPPIHIIILKVIEVCMNMINNSNALINYYCSIPEYNFNIQRCFCLYVVVVTPIYLP